MTPFEAEQAAPPMTALDGPIFARLEKLGITPARACSDGVFVRRAFLDVIGTLPTAKEARDFLGDRKEDKRRALIEKLLDREEYADYWAMKWGDILRVKAEFPINLWPNAAQAYHRWIRTSIKQNKHYDRFVREMLLSSGSNFREPAVNIYRAMQARDPQTIARMIALTFMGTRVETWPKEKLAGFVAFFGQVGFKKTLEWKEEIVFYDRSLPVPVGAVFPDGTPAKLSADQDPREVLCNWLISEKNPWFAKSIVNRVWSWLLGRGIIHEPDDIRPDNPPVHPEALAILEKELASAKWDLKRVLRVILNSRTYQLASVPPARLADERAAAEAERYFARYPLRRLEAEVLTDALCQITGTTEKYTSPIPEPFSFIPEDQRSIALPDGSITSSFLEMFGRPPRDTGLESERNNKPSPGQRLHMLNSGHIQRKIEQGRKLQALVAYGGKTREIAESFYLTILSRVPTDEEIKVVEKYTESSAAKGKEAFIDLAWALMNSVEFLYRH